MINRLTTGQRLSRDLCEMDVPQGDTIEVCPIDLSSRVDAEIKSLQQQLAECQAALAVKDEAIEFLADGMNPESMGYRDAQKALALQPGTDAMDKLWGEPVFIQSDHLQKARVAPFLCRVEPIMREGGFEPLYAKPKGLP